MGQVKRTKCKVHFRLEQTPNPPYLECPAPSHLQGIGLCLIASPDRLGFIAVNQAETYLWYHVWHFGQLPTYNLPPCRSVWKRCGITRYTRMSMLNGTKRQIIHLYLNVREFLNNVLHQTCKRGLTVVKETRFDALKPPERTNNVTFSSAARKPIKMHPWVRGMPSPLLHAAESCLAIILLQCASSAD